MGEEDREGWLIHPLFLEIIRIIQFLCRIPAKMVVMPDPADLEYGRIAVKNNFVSEKEIESCLQLKENLHKRSGNEYRLGDLLIEKGLLSDEQDRAVSRAMQRIQESARKRRITDQIPKPETTSGDSKTPGSQLQLLEEPEDQNPVCGQCGVSVARGSSRCGQCHVELCFGCQAVRNPKDRSCSCCGRSFHVPATRRRRPTTRGSVRQYGKQRSTGNSWAWIVATLVLVLAVLWVWLTR